MDWLSDIDDLCIMLCTAPDQQTAETLARAVVGDGLVACVNIIAQVKSIYRWKGKVCEDGEQLLVMKTSKARLVELSARVRALHPYDTPELIATPLSGGWAPYVDWVRSETR